MYILDKENEYSKISDLLLFFELAWFFLSIFIVITILLYDGCEKLMKIVRNGDHTGKKYYH